jgi:hypothetical protein
MDETPRAAEVVGREQTGGWPAASPEQDDAAPARERGCATTEVDLRLSDSGLRGPARAAVTSEVERAAALPEDPETVSGERNPSGYP